MGDTKEALIKVLEDKGYLDAGSIARTVFEMKAKMIKDHLDGKHPEEQIFGIPLFDFDTQEALIKVLEDKGYPDVRSIAARVFGMKAKMINAHLDGKHPEEQIFGILLFGFDTKEALIEVLEDKGYPDARSIAARVFEMKGDQLLQHLESASPEQAKFGILLFKFSTQEALRQDLEGKGYPDAAPIAYKVFEWKGDQLLKHLKSVSRKEAKYGISLFDFPTRELLQQHLEEKGYPDAAPIAYKVFEWKEQNDRQPRMRLLRNWRRHSSPFQSRPKLCGPSGK